MLCPLIFLAGSPLVLSFAGGSDYDLALSVSRLLDSPVVLLAEPGRTWPKFEIEGKDKADLFARFLVKTKLQGTPPALTSTGIGLASVAWPKGTFPVNDRMLQPTNIVGWSDPKSGKFRSNEAVKVGQLISMEKARVEPHWFFKDLHVLFAGPRNDDRFWVSVARATGARYSKSGDKIHLDFNATEFRKRILAMRCPRHIDELRWEFCVEAYRVATDDVLKRAFANDNTTTTFPIPRGTRLWSLAEERYRVEFEAPNRPPSSSIKAILARVDDSLGFGAFIAAPSLAETLLYYRTTSGGIGHFVF